MVTKEEIIDKNMVIFCSTQEEWDTVTKDFKLEWSYETPFKQGNNCIRPKGQAYDILPFYQGQGRTIITFQQYINGFNYIYELWN